MVALVCDVLIVGAGMAGLMAADVLKRQGLGVTVVDKGRSVGGRLATRRIGPGLADHGAQFFTVRSSEFRALVDGWLADGLIYRWSTGWTDGSLSPATPDGHPRYAVRGGMNALAKHLARGLDTQVDVRLVRVERDGDGWRCKDQNGQTYISQALVLTPPVPQSLALLDAGGIQLAAEDRAALERVEYAPCVAGLFWLDGQVRLPEPGAVQSPDSAISWMADNQRKGISPEATILTVHAGPALSRQLFQASEREGLATLQAGLKPYLDQKARIVEAQLKRWRYAMPTELYPERCLMARGLPALVFAGDAFGEPRVEGAALSGLFAGQSIAERLSIPPEIEHEHLKIY